MKMILNAVYRLRGGLYGRILSIDNPTQDDYPVELGLYDTQEDAAAGRMQTEKPAWLTAKGNMFAHNEASDYDIVELLQMADAAQLGDFALTLDADGALRVEHAEGTLLVSFDGANAVTLGVKKVQP